MNLISSLSVFGFHLTKCNPGGIWLEEKSQWVRAKLPLPQPTCASLWIAGKAKLAADLAGITPPGRLGGRQRGKITEEVRVNLLSDVGCLVVDLVEFENLEIFFTLGFSLGLLGFLALSLGIKCSIPQGLNELSSGQWAGKDPCIFPFFVFFHFLMVYLLEGRRG